jgi:hypothetical protein
MATVLEEYNTEEQIPVVLFCVRRRPQCKCLWWEFFCYVKRFAGGSRNSLNDLFFCVCEAIGTAATPGVLYQPRVMMNMIAEKQMECRLARETKVLGENLPQRLFFPLQNRT